MANSKVSLKLLINKKAQKVLFAEAGRDTVDFLFNILALPVGTIVRLLRKQQMVGCVANLYKSFETLDQDYIQPNQSKDTLLEPQVPIYATDSPLLKLGNTTPTWSEKRFYMCNYRYNEDEEDYNFLWEEGYNHNKRIHNYVSDNELAVCPRCNRTMSKEMTYVSAGGGGSTSAQGALLAAGEGGFVKGVVTYMVMDNLVVKPMSTISSITLLNQFNVKDVGSLEEQIVDLDMTMALKLLKESLHSKAVLTSVFLGISKKEQ